MKTIVFTAQNFSFGPVSKMLSISESLTGYRKIFLGAGTAYDLACLHHFDEIYRLEHENEKEIADLLARSDLFINVMDFPLVSLAKRSGCPCFLIDSLLWFWPKFPNQAREADVYFCQEFFGATKEKIEDKQTDNLKIIGPIVANQFQRLPKINQAIINFGGIENPFVTIGENSDYPVVILKTILPELQKHFSQILVTGRESVMLSLKSHFHGYSSVSFKMLDQKSMLEELYRSEALFTAPGIQTFYDAADKLPIFCLPPQNNSNVRNLQILIDQVAIKHSLQWQEIYEFPFDECQGDEVKEFDLVLSVIHDFAKDNQCQRILQQRITEFITQRDTWPQLIEQQTKTLSLYGNGLTTILDCIHTQLHQTRETSHSLKTGV